MSKYFYDQQREFILNLGIAEKIRLTRFTTITGSGMYSIQVIINGENHDLIISETKEKLEERFSVLMKILCTPGIVGIVAVLKDDALIFPGEEGFDI